MPIKTTALYVHSIGGAHLPGKGVNEPTEKPEDTDSDVGTVGTSEHVESRTEDVGLQFLAVLDEFPDALLFVLFVEDCEGAREGRLGGVLETRYVFADHISTNH